MGLACIHRDLVKFDSFKDSRYQLVRDPLKRIIHSAQLVTKNRLNSTRDIDRALVKSVLSVLDGVSVQSKRRVLARKISPLSWMTKEAEYVRWLGKENPDELESLREGYLWIRGPPGRGKTSASLAALDEIENMIRAEEECSTDLGTPLLAYFFCDSSSDGNSAEELVKALLRQLIDQQEGLAAYAKQFAKKKGEGTKSRAMLSIENLWQCLQDMLTDDYVGTVYFVINNLHALSEDAESTTKLLDYIRGEVHGQNVEGRKVRWLFTSRENHGIEETLRGNALHLIDLEDERYGSQVQMELRKYAQQLVASLGIEKKYNKALAYFATSLIGKRAQNTHWIDITCIQLGMLPPAENDLRVRRVLEGVPQDLKALLDRAWLSIFSTNGDDVERIKEMLRALVLTYEDPTEPELAVLAGFSNSDQEKAELRSLVEKCKPLLTIKKSGKAGNRVAFMNMVMKTHLQENSGTLLGLSEEETKWQHGMLALRCFSHLSECLAEPAQPVPEVGEPQDGTGAEAQGEAAAEPKNPEGDAEKGEQGKDDAAAEDEVQSQAQDDDEAASETDSSDDDVDESDSEEDYDDSDDESESEWDGSVAGESGAPQEPTADESKAVEYAVKHWLHHASKATREIAEDLSLESDFWMPDSAVRKRWLVEYQRLTDTFDNFDITTLTGLHVAASVGFAHLVASLLKHGHEDELNKRDSMVNTPLHLAANYGRVNIVEELLNRGAIIDDGIDAEMPTPLMMAAYEGQVKIMSKLLRRGANGNAFAKKFGPVVSAAICSGSREAVQLLVESGVSLTLERPGIAAPLAMSALYSDMTMFNYLVDACADKLRPEEYGKALVKAAQAGKMDVLELLLRYQHPKSVFQDAVAAAAQQGEWGVIPVILKSCHDRLDCEQLFYSAATANEDQDALLDVIWEHTGASIFEQTLNNALYDATDMEKESTVRVLLEKFSADPNATGEE